MQKMEYFCDICGREMPEPDYGDLTERNDVNKIIGICGVKDICPQCLKRIRRTDLIAEIKKILKG